LLPLIIPSACRSEIREPWIELGAGGFGAFIPAGIRMGLDALESRKRTSAVSASLSLTAKSRHVLALPTAL